MLVCLWCVCVLNRKRAPHTDRRDHQLHTRTSQNNNAHKRELLDFHKTNTYTGTRTHAHSYHRRQQRTQNKSTLSAAGRPAVKRQNQTFKNKYASRKPCKSLTFAASAADVQPRTHPRGAGGAGATRLHTHTRRHAREIDTHSLTYNRTNA